MLKKYGTDGKIIGEKPRPTDKEWTEDDKQALLDEERDALDALADPADGG